MWLLKNVSGQTETSSLHKHIIHGINIFHSIFYQIFKYLK